MARRPKTAMTHVHRDAKAPKTKTDLLLHHHRLLRRSSGFMLARKYRNPWPTGNDFAREISSRLLPRVEHVNSGGSSSSSSVPATVAPATIATSTGSTSSNNSVVGLNGPKGYTRDELINFWRELSLVAKRRLLRIRRETYLTALDQFLVGQNLCCECHDNVIAEWEDHERKRSGSRSLQDIFSVFPPFLDDEDDEDDEEEDDKDDDDDDDDDEDEDSDELEDESDGGMLATDDMVLEEEELVFKYELEREGRRGPGGKGSVLSDEYLAALEVGKRQEDELLRLIQKEERYIIIREDHTDFIMDLIRCGEQFSYMSPYRSGFEDDESEDSEEDDDVDDMCPGANTSHLAQEYLLEVLAIKFREQLEDAYQDALQHSLAIQAELLRDEVADLKASQKPSSSSRKKKNKKEKKRRKKEAAAQRATVVVPRSASTHSRMSGTSNRRPSAVVKKRQSTLALTDGSGDSSETEVRDAEEDEIDREVEQFRLLLEKINTESVLRSRKKLVLPPGSFAHLTSMTVS